MLNGKIIGDVAAIRRDVAHNVGVEAVSDGQHNLMAEYGSLD